MTPRLLHFVVQPVLVLDDGNNLTAGPPIQPRTVSLDELRSLADKWPDELSAISAQLNPPDEGDSSVT